jgi:hypothetical protein
MITMTKMMIMYLSGGVGKTLLCLSQMRGQAIETAGVYPSEDTL